MWLTTLLVYVLVDDSSNWRVGVDFEISFCDQNNAFVTLDRYGRSTMNIATTRRQATAPKPDPKPPVPEYPKPVLDGPFGQGMDGWRGPVDGRSKLEHQWLLRPLGRALIAATNRVEVEGAENFPHEGKHVYCPTHPTFMDPTIITTLTNRDMRYIAAENVFNGIRGPVMTAGGAFPTNLNFARPTTIRHAVDMVKQGKGFTIFPEGKISDQKDKVDRLKRGAATIAHWGGAETIVPISIVYDKDQKARLGERLTGFLAAGAMLAGSVLAASGGPTTRMLAGAVTGAVATAFAAGTIAHKSTTALENDDIKDPFPKLFARLQWGALGALAGGVAGGLAASPATLPFLGLAGGVGTIGLTEGWATRPVARVKVGQPMEVAPYFEGNSTKEGAVAMTKDLHQTLGQLKAEQTGVDYDPESRKVFDRSIDPPIGVGWEL